VCFEGCGEEVNRRHSPTAKLKKASLQETATEDDGKGTLGSRSGRFHSSDLKDLSDSARKTLIGGKWGGGAKTEDGSLASVGLAFIAKVCIPSGPSPEGEG